MQKGDYKQISQSSYAIGNLYSTEPGFPGRNLIAEYTEAMVTRNMAFQLKYSFPNNMAHVKMVYKYILGNEKGFRAFCKIIDKKENKYQLAGRILYNQEMLYSIFCTNAICAYFFKKHKLKTWEEVVYYIENNIE